MKKILLILALLTMNHNLRAQYPIDDHWYENPLGFKPLQLHTSMGFILPALAVGACLLLTENEANLKKRISIYDEIGFSWGYKYPHTFLAQKSAGIIFKLRNWMSLGIEFDLYFPKDRFNSTFGVAIRPLARFYPVSNEKWRLYFESGGGWLYLMDCFPKPTDKDPRLGTRLNGTTKYGIGSEINISKFTSIIIGIRHIHISNGNTKGVERNPSHDSNGFFIGFNHRL